MCGNKTYEWHPQSPHHIAPLFIAPTANTFICPLTDIVVKWPTETADTQSETKHEMEMETKQMEQHSVGGWKKGGEGLTCC